MAFVTVVPQTSAGPGLVGPATATIQSGTRSVGLRAIMDTAAVQDAALEIPFLIEGSFDSGVNWVILVQNTWHGGGVARDGSPSVPQQHYTSDRMPSQMRLSATLPRTLNIGLQSETF